MLPYSLGTPTLIINKDYWFRSFDTSSFGTNQSNSIKVSNFFESTNFWYQCNLQSHRSRPIIDFYFTLPFPDLNRK